MTLRNVVFIRHKVANFRKWKAVFDAHAPVRRARGCQGTQVFRRADNPKELVIMLTWSDLGKAREYIVSDDLAEMLAEIPVSDRNPDVYLLEELDQLCQSMGTDRPPVVADEPSGTIGNGVLLSAPALSGPTEASVAKAD
ncbi:MAG TPA: antibiotic biosynthesis monooxygenase [Candidatus Methylomirabilis sp.]|nr:antibiotic biosynthesis monooxygenase [Candidatus Methylomirabilis sp.]